MNNKTVCAVVVTYNRKKLLIECLKALENQTRPVNAIYIIDNASTDGTPELLLENKYLEELPAKELKENFEKTIQKDNTTIHYLRMPKNMGGAGGFYEGVKRAYDKGYDWVWLMDDDSEPLESCLSSLMDYKDIENVSGLCSKVFDVNNSIITISRGYFNFNGIPMQDSVSLKSYEKNKCIEIDMCSFVGLLVPRNAIEAIGVPNKDFFIHADDLEYCIRLRTTGKILLITDSIIIHKDEQSKNYLIKEKFNRKSIRHPYDALWLTYFYHRNIFWIGIKYGQNKIRLYYEVLIKLLAIIIGILVYDDHKIKRINFIKEAYSDGFRENFDNKKPKNLLYGDNN